MPKNNKSKNKNNGARMNMKANSTPSDTTQLLGRCKTCSQKCRLINVCQICGFHGYCSPECEIISQPEHMEWCSVVSENNYDNSKGHVRIMHDRAFGGAVSMLLHHGTSLHGKGMIHAECSHGLSEYCGARRKANCDERKITLTFVPAGRDVLDLQKETMSDGQAERDEEGFGALECAMFSFDKLIADEFEEYAGLDADEPTYSRFCIVGLQDGVTKYMDLTMYFTYMSQVHPANREFKMLMGNKLSVELEWEYNNDTEMQILIQKAVGQKYYNNLRVEWEKLRNPDLGEIRGAMLMLASKSLMPPFGLGIDLKKNPNYKPTAEEKKHKKSLDPNHRQCANCAGQGDGGSKLKKCRRCENTYYCSRACQAADWKNGHKQFCKTKEERSASSQPLAPRPIPASSSGSGGTGGGASSDECVICKNNQDDTSKKLPCGHSFHRECLLDLFTYGATQTCPICRKPLPSKKALQSIS